MRPFKLLSFTPVAAALCFCCGQGQKEQLCVPALADSLTAVFDDLKEAWQENRSVEFFDLLDPAQAGKLLAVARQHGYASIRPLIGWQFGSWPDLDTLNFRELKEAQDYARLTFTGSGRKASYFPARIKYTFLLFRRTGGSWKLAAITSLEKQKRDRYGYEITYHETELPPKLRFPRLF